MRFWISDGLVSRSRCSDGVPGRLLPSCWTSTIVYACHLTKDGRAVLHPATQPCAENTLPLSPKRAKNTAKVQPATRKLGAVSRTQLPGIAPRDVDWRI